MPDDLNGLLGFLHLIRDHLSEKADDAGATWEMALQIASEVEVLLDLEREVAERAAAIPAQSLGDVRAKLEIWGCLVDEYEDDEAGCGAGLVRSVRRDIDTLLTGAPGTSPDARSGRRQGCPRPCPD